MENNLPLVAPNFVPDDDRVVIKADIAPEKIGNIYVPKDEKSKEALKPTKGIVVALGSKVEPDEVCFVGAKVWYSKLAGVEANLHPSPYVNDDVYLIIRRMDIMGNIPGEDQLVTPCP
jgi:co-chaperonin GroES (HSP10)